MKFAVAVVVLCALAVGGARCSALSLGPALITTGPLPLGSVAIQTSLPAAPVVLLTSPATAAAAAPQPVVAQIIPPAAPTTTTTTTTTSTAAPAVEATYVAKTRGAVHAAPLPGHSTSAAALNEQPAPGTE